MMKEFKNYNTPLHHCGEGGVCKNHKCINVMYRIQILSTNTTLQ